MHCAEVLLPYLKLYGNQALAYSTLQRGIRHLHIHGIGYLAYAELPAMPPVLRKSAAVLSDPVCHPSNFMILTLALLERYKEPMFLQISSNYAPTLQALGFKINMMGGETEVGVHKILIQAQVQA